MQVMSGLSNLIGQVWESQKRISINTKHSYQATTKRMHNQNRARVMHTIVLTVNNKLYMLFQLKKKTIAICFDSCKFLLLTYFSQKKKILKLYPIHYVMQLPVSTLLNISAVITAKMFPKGKSPVINSAKYCKTAPATDSNFLLFLVSTCLSIPRNVKWLSE